ncbi:MAG: hypothetical protein EBR52_09925 [Microbacteriaceae bacterium]|nr:hypothetical protein [Microbacteriaceae bacterium]
MVAVLQGKPARHFLVVDESPVGAAEVLDLENVGVGDDAGVLAGDAWFLDDHGAIRSAADGGFCRVEGVPLEQFPVQARQARAVPPRRVEYRQGARLRDDGFVIRHAAQPSENV